jgi:hypothetical protein
MPMTAEEMDGIVETLKRTPGILQCPMCKAMNWEVADTLYGLCVYEPGGRGLILDTFAPLVVTVCTECGFTANFASRFFPDIGSGSQDSAPQDDGEGPPTEGNS